MIKVSVFYPNEPGARFDDAYAREAHADGGSEARRCLPAVYRR